MEPVTVANCENLEIVGLTVDHVRKPFSRGVIEKIKAFAEKMGGDITATRKMVDNDYLPYNLQVGLTGKTVAPAVYIAVGISGAVHQIVGMQRAGTVIAINPDKDAPIFDYADYGIVACIEDVLNHAYRLSR